MGIWDGGQPTGAKIDPNDGQLPLDHYFGVDEKELMLIEGQRRTKIYNALKTLAGELLEASKEDGIGFDDVRLEAQRRNILTGGEPDRFLSFGSALMKSVGGRVRLYRRSKMKQSTRRKVAQYVLAKYDVTSTERERAS